MISVKPNPIVEDKNVVIYQNDVDLIKQIYDKCGEIAAVRVTRWLTNNSLSECYRFVKSL